MLSDGQNAVEAVGKEILERFPHKQFGIDLLLPLVVVGGMFLIISNLLSHSLRYKTALIQTLLKGQSNSQIPRGW